MNSLLTRLLLPQDRRFWLGFVVAGIILLGLIPLLNLAPEKARLHLPNYMVPLLGKYLCYALLALALDLVWVTPVSFRWATVLFSPWAVTPWACI